MDEHVSTFLSLTAATAEDAVTYLEMAGGDPGVAANLYWEYSESHKSQNLVDQLSREPDVRAPIEARVDNLLGNSYNDERRSARSSMPIRGPLINYNNSAFFSEGGTAQTEADMAFQEMFRNPSDIIEEGSFASTREAAKAEDKYLLVNIQNSDEFASLALNRDVWADETMQEFLKSSYLFWQRDAKSPEGQSFLNFYKVSETPHIAVINPRTGRCMKQWPVSKFKNAFLGIEILSGFADANPIAAPERRQRRVEETASIEIPDFPKTLEAGAEGAVRVAMRLSNGLREPVIFSDSSSLENLLIWAAAREQTGIDQISISTIDRKNLKKDFDVINTTIKESGLAGSLLTVTRQ